MPGTCGVDTKRNGSDVAISEELPVLSVGVSADNFDQLWNLDLKNNIKISKRNPMSTILFVY